ncbi:MAG: hypothetical protein SFY96_00830 [Planctomycetota bacterium]|nr:hypothetical protein [Planctomycetota bacterium]
MAEQSAVSVRRSSRHDVSLRAQLCIAGTHANVVRLAAPAGARQGWLDVDVVDVSVGGLGFITSVFLPRDCRARLRVFLDDSASPTAEVPLRLHRVNMTDRRPSYLIGASITDASDAEREKWKGVMTRISGEAA